MRWEPKPLLEVRHARCAPAITLLCLIFLSCYLYIRFSLIREPVKPTCDSHQN